jgi:peptide/nickel transport system permease protein
MNSSNTWTSFRNIPSAWLAFRLLCLFALIGLFADIIANDKPLYCKLDHKHHFPVFQDYLVRLGYATWPATMASGNWSELPYQKVIFPPIPYAPQSIDRKNLNYVGPFDHQRVPSLRYRHWLGTDQIGRDVAAGLIRGTRTAFVVGFVSMGIALIIGIFIGAIAGFFGDDSILITRAQLITNLLAIPLALFFSTVPAPGSQESGWWFSILLVIAIFLVANLFAYPLRKWPLSGNRLALPLDLLIMRSIEVLNAIPALLLLLSVAAVMKKPSLLMVMVIIGLIRWTGIAKFVRAELLRIRRLEYIEAVRLLGYPKWQILWSHAVPNALGPVLISLSFGIAGAILLEAFISFLGIGTAPDDVTWGTMLNVSRSNFRAWWLALAPGMAIFVTVALLNIVGEGLSRAANPTAFTHNPLR